MGFVRGSSKESTHYGRTYQIHYAAVILRPVANVVYCALNGDRSVRAANRCEDELRMSLNTRVTV